MTRIRRSLPSSQIGLINRKGLLLGLLALLLFLTPLSAPAASSRSQTEQTSTSEQEEVPATGWARTDQGICYRYRSGRKVTGFAKLKKHWYHFDENGNLSLGWFTVGSSRYYAGTRGLLGSRLGALKSGYILVDGTYYSFSAQGGAGKYGKQDTGWVSAAGKTFYYQANGSKASGLVWIRGKLYYFARTGSLKTKGRLYTGWKTLNGKKYYFRKDQGVGIYGSAYRNATVIIGKKTYTFSKKGYVKGGQAASKKAASKASAKKRTLGSQNDKFIEKIGAMAHADMQSSGILASVTVAQAIVESNYGKSLLASRAHNLFGMKAALSGNEWGSTWSGRIYRKKTREVIGGRSVYIRANFRRYSTWAQSIEDHSAYLSGARKGTALRYSGIVGEKNYRKAAKIIKRGGYATAPNYVKALCDVIKKYDLTRFDK